MYKKYFSPTGLAIVLFLTCLVFFSCKKKASETAVSVSSQRITEWATYEADTLYSKNVYHYSGNLLSDLIFYNSRMVKLYKVVLSYNGSQIASYTRFDTTGGNWIKRSYTEVTLYNGSTPSEFIIHSYDQTGTETGKTKRSMVFSGALITAKIYYTYSSGSWTETSRYENTYDNASRLILMKYLSTLYGFEDHYRYTYQGNNMTTEQDSSYANPDWYVWKYNCQYANSKLSSVQEYDWNNNTWTLSYNESYTYNAEGNEIKYQGISADSTNRFREEITYEGGAGNFRQFAFIYSGYMNLPGMPWPYPLKSTVADPGIHPSAMSFHQPRKPAGNK
ncbi:MAG: hypothetical protein WCO44_02415 [Bacteroidota bacterium]